MPLQAPIIDLTSKWNEQEKRSVSEMLKYAFVGDPLEVKTSLQAFLDNYQVDEIMVVSHIYDHIAQLRSYKMLISK